MFYEISDDFYFFQAGIFVYFELKEMCTLPLE